MSPPRPAREQGPPVAGAVAGVGAFLLEHPERVRSVARRLQESERLLESRVGGGSMGRQLPDGAPIQIQLSRRERYAAGEVIAFLNGERVTVHRVLFCGGAGRRRGVVITRGDAHLYPDLPFHLSSVLGPVVAVKLDPDHDPDWMAPPALPRQPLAQRAIAQALFMVAAGLCAVDLGFARQSLERLYLVGRAVLRPLRRWQGA